MKTFHSLITQLSRAYLISNRLGVLSAILICLPPGAHAADVGKTFATPDEAVASFATVIRTRNVDSLREVLGPDSQDLENPDRVQAAKEFRAVAEALDQRTHLVRESETNYVVELGTNSWPFPIPIVKNSAGRWFFDTAAGKEELLNRRIGKNELEALQVMRAYVTAQREYVKRDHTGDGLLQFAQKLGSSPGKTDGLYWPPEVNGEISPLGPLIAEAQGAGYFGNGSDVGPQPFYGYFFKVLKGQGKHAPGGKLDYVVKGKMTKGFALVAWPAEYDESGVMTFIVNQQGLVYQKDLGEETSKLVSKMTLYDPDESWSLSKD
jgi:hypothetical protein